MRDKKLSCVFVGCLRAGSWVITSKHRRPQENTVGASICGSPLDDIPSLLDCATSRNPSRLEARLVRAMTTIPYSIASNREYLPLYTTPKI